jgi:uncharacterized protein (TIGR00255 family)
MTISGMTGFARVEGEHAGLRWAWEAKSVNGRGLDLKLRTPSGFDMLEPQARALAQAKFKRGSLQVSLNLARDAAAPPPLKIDHALVESLLAAGQPYVDSGRVAPPRWDGLLSVRGVMQSEESVVDEEARAALEAALLDGFGKVLDGLAEARQAEGRMLAGVLGELANKLDAGIVAARATAAAAPAAALERIKQRLAALSPEVAMDDCGDAGGCVRRVGALGGACSGVAFAVEEAGAGGAAFGFFEPRADARGQYIELEVGRS